MSAAGSNSTDQDKTIELYRLLDLWRETDQTEDEIVFALEALRVEKEIVEWTAEFSRDEMRGALLFTIGTNYQKRHQKTRIDDLELAIAALESALTIRIRETNAEDWAKTIYHLAHAFSDRIAGDRAENIEKAIGLYREALSVLTPEKFPQEAADIGSSLALAYANRIRGERAENIELTIMYCESVLGAVSRESFPYQWGQAQSNLGLAYADRILGDRAENLERAIDANQKAITALALESHPYAWALIQNNLALAYDKRIRGAHSENLERAIEALDAALKVITREAYPLDWATAQNNLSTIYIDRVHGDRAKNLESAIGYIEAAMSVYARATHPNDWAMCQLNLGLTYLRRISGPRAENIERAIELSAAALDIYSQVAFPQRWAALQQNLGLAYSDRILGDRAENIEIAITHMESALTVYTRQAFPHDWAQVQNLLAIAYRDRILGDPSDNLEKSIDAFNSALLIFTRDADPLGWATILSNLINTYILRIRGERGQNLDRAINAGEAALSVLTRQGQPLVWGRTHNNLAAAYARSLRGDPASNLEKAIGHFEAALSYFTRDSDMQQWALLQDNLGIAYTDRIRGSKAANIERAIFHLDAALTHFTPEVDRLQWAKIQNNLGLAYWSRVEGEHLANLQMAIFHLQRALSVRTIDALPHEWAQTQHNLGLAYGDPLSEARTYDLDRSIASYEAALTVYTPESFPRDHLITSRLLGAALIEKGDWARARLAFLSARDSFLILFGEGLVEREARDLIEAAGSLFGQLAFVTVELGDTAEALELLSEGKARLAAIALKLRAIEAATGQSARLSVLRQEIQKAERLLDRAQGIERTTALEHLVSLRSELRSLVTAEEANLPAHKSARAIADSVASSGGALVAPVITSAGAKVIIVTPSEHASRIGAISEKKLNTNWLQEFMEGPSDLTMIGGWLGAYNIQYLPEHEQGARIGEWLSAIERLGSELWRVLGKSLHEALSQHGVKPGARLFWLPTDALGLLPLGLAQNPETGSMLGEIYDIAYIPSPNMLRSASDEIPAQQTLTLAAIINPTKDLQFTEIEGELIASHFEPANRIVIERELATPSAVLAALSGRSYWHFAGHGIFSWADARESAIILSGETPLTVGDLFDASNLGKPRLVVLSACETGLYGFRHAPDEFVGLPSAFMALGASGVVCTLWPVDDRASALLIARFYDALIDERLSPSLALRRAQNWLRNSTRRDIIAYVRTAEKTGRIAGSKKLQQLKDSLLRGMLENGRFAPIWTWLQRRDDVQRQGLAGDGGRQLGKAKATERLFAHPYFWAGFIYTGA